MTIASVRVEQWGKKFVVVGEFQGLMEIPRQEYNSYLEALHEMAKVVQREEIRHAASINRASHW